MNHTVLLVIDPQGRGHGVYHEYIDLACLGKLHIRRGAHCEPDAHGKWHCDLRPVGGPVLGPYSVRSAALTAEQSWLTENWLHAARDHAQHDRAACIRAPHPEPSDTDR